MKNLIDNLRQKNIADVKLIPTKKIDCLLTEYEMLQNNISRRDLANLTLGSILIPSTLVILAVAIEFRESLDLLLPFVRASGFLPLFSSLLLLTASLFSYRARQIARFCYERMNEIETELEMKGNKYIYAKMKGTWYYKIWPYMWMSLFIIGFIAFIVTSVLLFIGFESFSSSETSLSIFSSLLS